MVSAWWLVVAASLGFSIGFLLVAALAMTADDEGSQLDDHHATDTTPQHT
jgi:hypothetical protein